MPSTLKLVRLSAGPSTSVSLASRLPLMGVSSGVVATSATATGASSTAITLRLTVAGSETAPLLSVTVNTMPALPEKSGAGLNSSPAACAGVSVWPASTGVMPSASSKLLPGGTLTMVTPAMLPSTSWPVSEIGKTASSCPLTLAGVATGASFTAVRPMFVVPLDVPPPLVTV